ncbi:MAG: HD domain-containing protein [Alphaproteobacteria bacterium]|nr:HD domain-containing protein [Alphaproteobacteria bacterium]
MFSTDNLYEVVSFSTDTTKTGNKMGRLLLKDTSTGSMLNCMLWEERLNQHSPKTFKPGNILRIISATQNPNYNNCTLENVKLIKEARLGLSEEETTFYWNKLQSYISKIKDEKLKNFISEQISKHQDSFKIKPAGISMHHNFAGGLLVHTVECLEFAELNMSKFACEINEDNIYAATTLHDLGKIFEYNIDLETGAITYVDTFKTDFISHSQYGYCLCLTNGFKMVARMIAAHHGRTDWGAIIDLGERDIEPELYFLHLIDNMSAKYGKINIKMFDGE